MSGNHIEIKERPISPEIVFVDPRKETLALFVGPNDSLFADNTIVRSFKEVDDLYKADPLGYFRNIYKSARTLKTTHGPLDISYFGQQLGPKTGDFTVVFSPLNDGRPMSTPDDVYGYTRSKHTKKDKKNAQPNSWGSAIKLAISHGFAAASGFGMSHLQLYAREVPALSPQERHMISRGDTRPYGRLAVEALSRVAVENDRSMDDNGEITRLHLFCAGMGPKALGAARYLIDSSDYQVASVTLMNLSIGKTNAFELERKYGGRLKTGEPSTEQLPKDFYKIIEPQVRREVDGFGAEFEMRLRQARAMLDTRVVMGIMAKEQPADDIKWLLDKGVTVTVANARNESIVEQTERFLPIGADKFHYVEINGVEGQKPGMKSNEHAALVAYLKSLGRRNWQQDQL